MLVHLGFGHVGPRKEERKGIRQKMKVIPPKEIVVSTTAAALVHVVAIAECLQTVASSTWVIETPLGPQESHSTPLVLYPPIHRKGG